MLELMPKWKGMTIFEVFVLAVSKINRKYF